MFILLDRNACAKRLLNRVIRSEPLLFHVRGNRNTAKNTRHALILRNREVALASEVFVSHIKTGLIFGANVATNRLKKLCPLNVRSPLLLTQTSKLAG
jgi:hypothetical protein